MAQSKKFISPGAWFSMMYPADWNEFEDGEAVISAKSEFEDSSFTDKITVLTYDPDFRDEV